MQRNNIAKIIIARDPLMPNKVDRSNSSRARARRMGKTSKI